MDSPFIPSSVKSGAKNPSRGLGMRPPVVAELGTTESQIQAKPNTKTTTMRESQWDLRFIAFSKRVLITGKSCLLTPQFDHTRATGGNGIRLMNASDIRRDKRSTHFACVVGAHGRPPLRNIFIGDLIFC